MIDRFNMEYNCSFVDVILVRRAHGVHSGPPVVVHYRFTVRKSMEPCIRNRSLGSIRDDCQLLVNVPSD
jgi:hypothetical protein